VSPPVTQYFALFSSFEGASVFIIANTSKHDKVTNARTLMLMEERESIGCAVESLGGGWISTLDDGNRTITHAIWIASGEDEQADHISHLSSEALVKLNTCLELDIPGALRSVYAY
jgi:hypothetical protein